MKTSTNYLDPIAAIEKPRTDLIRYLLTAYPWRDPHLRYSLQKQLEAPGQIWQHPYVEGSQPYRTSQTIADLVQKGLLHQGLTQLFRSNRPLYQHQETAIRSVVAHQENIIVATGTGSGKTECFLIPILDYLLKEAETNREPGVRVLILYPMNALVNDQVKRLRQILCQQTEPLLRFGFYTSRTEKETATAQKMLREELEAYDPEELNKLIKLPETITQQERIERALGKVSEIQVLSRQEFWENPPQILLTNYSMLEHMLIRPKERESIFRVSSSHFQFLIVDEAHSYNGATGTEVAMLLKRLKKALSIENPGQIRCIATSASLGDKSQDPQVLKFAAELFGEEFSLVIRGERVSARERLGNPYTLESPSQPLWDILANLQLPSLRDSLDTWRQTLEVLVPPESLAAALTQVSQHQTEKQQVQTFLWYALHRHPLFHRLINLLAEGPQPWHHLAQSLELWENTTSNPVLERALANLIQLGTMARANPEDFPLLPVRLHLLFRSLEGVYGCINSECPGGIKDPASNVPLRYGRIYLNQQETCGYCGGPVLELASCRKCGQAYSLTCLVEQQLKPLPRSLEALINNQNLYTLTVGNLDSVTEDEEIEIEEEANPKKNPRQGFFTIKPNVNDLTWQGKAEQAPPVNPGKYLLHWHLQKPGQSPLSRCPGCGARQNNSPAISRLIAYTDAPLAVMLDSLFEILPEPASATPQFSQRQLLTFSDGRQDAAFFASDLQRTHTENLYRQMVWQSFQAVKDSQSIASLRQVEDHITEQFLSISLPHPDRNSDDHHKSYLPNDPVELILKNRRDCQEKARKRAKELLLREFGLPSARRFSLEALGLLACYPDLSSFPFLATVGEKFQLQPPEVRLFLTTLLNSLRQSGMVDLTGASNYFPETGGIAGNLPAVLDPQGRSLKRIELLKSSKDNHVASFLWRTNAQTDQIASRQNRLVSYYLNILPQVNKPELIWLFESLQQTQWLIKHPKEGYQVNWQLFNLRETRQNWYQCHSCQQLFYLPELERILRPEFHDCLAYQCQGKLQPHVLNPAIQEPNHYRYLIQQRELIPLRAGEHTAQLSVIELERRENLFKRGRINLLSSSTTLEMGVDIGDLQVVALRNFPPYVSNYQQRAGRAGRRSDGVAITLMYGQRRPHDRYYFQHPELLIAGKNQIPQLNTTNFQIQKRHIRAELLTAFLEQELGKGAENISIGEVLALANSDFTPLSDLPPSALMTDFQQWLEGQTAQELTQNWLEILARPEKYSEVLEEFSESLANFQQSQLEDWNQLADTLQEINQELQNKLERNQRKSLEIRRDQLEQELEKIAQRNWHEELARASILPIYGFPIDVVRLLTGESNQYRSSQGKHRLERDRRLALGEYAPGQDIVVDDRVHRSVGIVLSKNLEKQYYWVCPQCNHFFKSKQHQDFSHCPRCELSLQPNQRKMRTYLIPKFFTTDWTQSPQVTPYQKPLRQPTSEVFFAREGYTSQTCDHSLPCNVSYSQGGLFFLANQGPLIKGRGFHNSGFAICRFCGRDLTNLQTKPKGKKTVETPEHTHPLTGKVCTGYPESLHLGHEFCSDFLRISFETTHFTHPNSRESLWPSLLAAVLAAAAFTIDIPRSELDGLYQRASNHHGLAELIIFDNVPGGALYSQQIAEKFPAVLDKALELVQNCTCQKSCYDCLRTYSNQPFHGDLNRHLVADFLTEILANLNPANQ